MNDTMDLSKLRDSAHLEMERRMRTLARSHIDGALSMIENVEAEARHADTEYAKRVFLRELCAYADELRRG